jgi:type II restriction/modification system DNA methylase subunit YeeA
LNPNGLSNSQVIRPWVNGQDVTGRPSDTWIVDFGEMTEEAAALFEAPFEYVRLHIKPLRDKNADRQRREKWWRLGRSGADLRAAVAPLSRVIATPRVAKHRFFVWIAPQVLPDSRINVIARDDDSTFGILHSRFHEAWSLRLGGWHGVGNDPQYTPSTGFETFPFPQGLAPNIPAEACVGDHRAARIANAAKALHGLRESWLNPPDLVHHVPEVVPGFPDRIVPVSPNAAAILKSRTLTNLYNERPTWLANAHRDLDAAVAAAYGWATDISDDDALAALLDENRARSGGNLMRA